MKIRILTLIYVGDFLEHLQNRNSLDTKGPFHPRLKNGIGNLTSCSPSKANGFFNLALLFRNQLDSTLGNRYSNCNFKLIRAVC